MAHNLDAADLAELVRSRARDEAATMCCLGTGECGIGPDCGEDQARLIALLEAADWVGAAQAPRQEAQT